MTSAIIFDCFGVLTTEGWIAFKNQHFGQDPAKMERASELSRLLDSGLITYEDSLHEIAAMAAVTPESLNRILKGVATNDQLLDYIRDELKPHYKIGMLSNVGDDWLRTLFRADQWEMFDAICLSYKMGVLKPQPQAYANVAQELGLEPESCIFVDDLERNITGAHNAGMGAVLYNDLAQFKIDLTKLTN